MLRTSETDIKKEAAWAISNVASSGSSDQIQYVLACGHLNLSSVFWHTELNMVICNDWLPFGCRYLVSRGCLEPLCSALTYSDPDLVYTCLEGLENILQAGEAGKKGEESGTNPYAEFILECGGLEKLEDLQDVDSDRIFELVMKLLQSYWEEEVSESDDPNIPGSNDSSDTVEATSEDAAQPPVPPPSGADEAE